MDTMKCNKCGEEYSSTYRKCPFCQEAAAERRGRPIYRRGKRLTKRQRMAGAFGVMKLVAAAAALCVLLFVFFGDNIAQFMGIRTNHGSDTQQQNPNQTQTDDTNQSGENTSGLPDDSQSPDNGDIVIQPLALSQSAISIPAGETARITATGGNGTVIWTSSNENIATVVDGAVTGIAGGTVTITATSGDEQLTCTVTVIGDPWVNPANLSLNHTDFTLREGDPPVQMKVKGTDSTVVWSSSNVNVATIDSNGVVRRVGKGNCTITAEVDGQTLTCIVRVA